MVRTKGKVTVYQVLGSLVSIALKFVSSLNDKRPVATWSISILKVV